MTFTPYDPTPVYVPDTKGTWVEDRRFSVGNITATMVRKPLTTRDYDRMMRAVPSRG